ncbi:MAG TPA: hypothetical protein DDW52_25480, partial [Planctomycetaceae bacterium]|nr:hypothetical protein [Planctomycetaceae bacterium]
DDSTDQLISMYDRQRDDVVAAEELREFLSRGLSRRPNLQMADDGYEDGALERSPWGPLDTNDDYVLQPGESSELVDRLAALDVDEDGFVNLAEATPPAAETMMSSGSMGLSPKTMLLVPTDDADPLQLRRDHSRLAARVIEHYTFLGQITAEQWPQMSDSEFGELDADSNQELDKSELRKLFEQPAHADIYVRFDAGDATQVHAVINRDGRVNQQQPGSQAGWVAAHEGGKLSLPGLALQIVIQDSFAANNKAMVLQTVGNALADDNLRESVTNQYQLGAEAFDVVDADSDGQLDANEQQRLWQWLRARQSSRMVGRWKLAAMPWFQLIDQNADRRLGMEEIREFSANFQTLFPGDEAVLGNSGPLLVSLEIQRRDPRLETIPQPTAMTDAPPELVAADWFEAMDSNADEAIELDEFIGDAADFAELDRDEDGFIRRNEVYTP